MKVLIADESQLNRKIVASVVANNNYSAIEVSNVNEFYEKLAQFMDEIGVIVLDIEFGGRKKGEEIAAELKQSNFSEIPIIFTSAFSERTDIEKGLLIGVFDYILKPIDPYITFLKIKNAMKYYKVVLDVKESESTISDMNRQLVENYRKIDELNGRVIEKNRILEVLVEARTKELNEMTFALISALEDANLYNDEITGNHIRRVSVYSELLASVYGLDEKVVNEIKIYSSLHDIGKVGIPDIILKKPGKYTPEEFEEMKKHVLIGYNMIKNSPLSDIAKNIVKYHHEKYDGSGYVEGIAGENIPIEARIVAISDVFDALTTKRSYKDAYTFDETRKIMYEGIGKHFDPVLLDLFFKEEEKVKEMMILHQD